MDDLMNEDSTMYLKTVHDIIDNVVDVIVEINKDIITLQKEIEAVKTRIKQLERYETDIENRIAITDDIHTDNDSSDSDVNASDESV